MTKSNKQDELTEALLMWAEEDEDNRSVLVLVSDEGNTSLAYNGTKQNLVTELAVLMHNDKRLRQVCADAMILLEDYEASVTKEQSNDKE